MGKKPIAVSLNEAAEMMRLSRRQVQEYIAIGRLPVRRVGNRVLVLVSEIEKFLSEDQPTPKELREKYQARLRKALGVGPSDVN